jgi:16S rRNA (cytosine1402-N4)-methyltransferase
VEHVPVLVESVVDLLLPALEGGGLVVDATLGRAGHARRILEAAPASQLVGIDRDPVALEASRANLAPYSDRVRLVGDDFANLAAVLERLGNPPLRGVLFDLGVSSPQLDDARRGFGFRADGPLDMRMDPGQRLSADEVVNTYSEERLETLLRRYGEERFARRIARAIGRARPIHTTGELAELVRNAIPAAARRRGPHPARRTFQAIRIEVNDELGALQRALPDAVDALEPGGRIAVVAYHSLEDRIVKQTFTKESRGCVCPPDFPVCRCGAQARIRILTRRPIRPPAEEVSSNPRSASARLRAAQRIGAASEPIPQIERKTA